MGITRKYKYIKNINNCEDILMIFTVELIFCMQTLSKSLKVLGVHSKSVVAKYVMSNRFRKVDCRLNFYSYKFQHISWYCFI